jgi:hypothetical protein
MALDRSWYNTLIDDDGSGLTGSVWDKADVNALMNAIDAEFLATGTGAAFPWTPNIGSAGGGTPIYTAQNGIGQKNGKLITCSGRVALSSKGSLVSGQVFIGGFPYLSAAIFQGGLVVGSFAGLAVSVASLSGYFAPGGTQATLTYIPAAGATAATGLTVAQISNVDLIFSASYRID